MSERRELHSLVVFHLAGIGGPQRSLGGAAAWLSERGSVEFIFPDRGPAAARYAEFGHVTVAVYHALAYARGLRARLRVLRRLVLEVRMFRRELRRRRPDLVVAVTTVLPAVLIAARLEKIPSVVYAAELYEQRWKGAPPLRLWGALLARATAALSDGVVSCSAAVARQFPARPSRPHAVAYPPIGREYAEGDRARGRARYGLAEEDFCLVVVGNLGRGRGQDVAIRALPLIRRHHPSARLLIVGAAHPRPADLAYAAELRALADSTGEAGSVVFAGPTDAMPDVYAAADVVVNPARIEESFGRVGPEALIAGRPVVASRVGAIPEAIRDGLDGLLVAPDDPAALARAACRLAADRALVAELVANGREAVRERFGPEQDVAAWAGVLEAVLSRRR
ncbi:MAG TPA: glycosyltransferase family 4 protein [Thermoleophilaceae bacterium]